MIEGVGLLDTGAHPSGVWHVWEPCSGWLPGTSLSFILGVLLTAPSVPKGSVLQFPQPDPSVPGNAD